MSDYIDREAAIRATDGELSITGEENMMAVAEYIQGVVERLKALPGRPKGRWLRYGEDGSPNDIDTTYWQCDQCLEIRRCRRVRPMNYCPDCGAEMSE